jgi:excinuclease ABC subunit B
VDGRVILYADQVTGSLERAVKETNRRREIQLAYNKQHGITPKTIIKKIQDITQTLAGERERTVSELLTLDLKAMGGNAKKLIKAKEKQMNVAVKNLDFETAAILRDEIKALAGLLDK